MGSIGIGIRLGLGGGGGGAPSAKTAKVASTSTGAVLLVTRLLGSTSTFSLLSGSNSNLSLNAGTGVVSAAAPIGAGVSQTAIVREAAGQLAIEYPLTITGQAVATPTPTPTPTPASTARPLMFLTNNGAITQNGSGSFDGSRATHDRVAGRRGDRLGHFSGGKGIQAVYTHWYVQQSPQQEVKAPGTYTVLEHYVFYQGVRKRMTVNGQNTWTVNSAVSHVLTDRLLASDFGPFTEFAADDVLETHLLIDRGDCTFFKGGGSIATNTGYSAPFTGQSFSFASSQNAGYTAAAAGALPTATGSVAGDNQILPCFLAYVGEHTSPKPKGNAYVGLGDSIAVAKLVATILGGGNANTTIPGVTLASSASEASDYLNSVASGATAYREALMQYADGGIIEWGANDFHSEVTGATMKERTKQVALRMKAQGGIANVFATTALPRVVEMPLAAGSVSGSTCTVTLPNGQTTSRMATGMTVSITGNDGWSTSSVAITVVDGQRLSFTHPSPPAAGFTNSSLASTYRIGDGKQSSVFMYPDSSAFVSGAGRDQYNGTLAAQLVSEGVLAGVLDTTSAVQDPTYTNLWWHLGNGGFNGGGSNRYANDGTHPSSAGTRAAAEKPYQALVAFAGGTAAAPPTNISPPTVSGTAQVGQTATASTGSWDPSSGNTYAFQWQRSTDSGDSWADISGSVSQTRVYAAADQGALVRVGVKAQNGNGASEFAYSDPTPAVTAAPAPLPAIGTPGSITTDGSPSVGETVTIVAASGLTNTDSVAYYLRRDGVNDATPIAPGGYVLKSTDICTTFELRTVATNATGSTAAVSANAGPVVAAVSSSTIVSNTLANSTTSAINVATSTYNCDTGQQLVEAGDPDSTSVFGTNGNHTVAASNARELSGSGAPVPLVYITAAALPTNYSVEVPFYHVAQATSAISVGAWARGKQTTRAGYFACFYTGTTTASQRWRIQKGADNTNAGSNATSGSTNLTTLKESTTSPALPVSAYYAVRFDTSVLPNGDVYLELHADLKDGNGFVKVLDYTDPAASAYAAPGRAGHLQTIAGTSYVKIKADQQPIRIVSR